MWSMRGDQVIHPSGLLIEVVDGTFINPMNLAIKGDDGLSAPELALLIREGLDFAAKQSSVRLVVDKKPALNQHVKKKRPILKLKK